MADGIRQVRMASVYSSTGRACRAFFASDNIASCENNAMLEINDVFDSDLSIMVFVYGSLGFLAVSVLAAIWVAGMHRRILWVMRSFILMADGGSVEEVSIHSLQGRRGRRRT